MDQQLVRALLFRCAGVLRDLLPYLPGQPKQSFLGRRNSQGRGPCLPEEAAWVVQPLPRPGTDGVHGYPQPSGKLLHVDADALLPGLIRHIEEHRHGPPQREQLQCQRQPPHQGGAVHHVQDEVGGLVQDGLPGRLFVRAAAREAVEARQVHHLLPRSPEPSPSAGHRHPRPVPRVLLPTREPVI